jgi:LmbE family N-acetylglucosaminyl deacetylase
MEGVPQRVLVVTPHPDDAEVWCGGTVAKWIKGGAAVYYLLCTDGSKGTSNPEITPQELAALREREQLQAARILGVKEVVMLHRSDGELEDTSDFRRDVVRQVRHIRPEVVLCPEPYRRNLAWHRDHRITGQVTQDAIFPYARDHLHHVELWRDEKLEPHKTGAILFWGTEQPNTYVDITDTIELKTRALLAHRSQVDGRLEQDITQFIQERAREAAAGQGYAYGEAFRRVTFRT